jgi:hypothetical protein
MEAHQRAISVHQHAMLCDIAEFSATEAFRGDGALSMAAWLSERCKVSAGSARTMVLTAEKVGELPALFDALSAGRLTLDVLAPLAAVATAETDAKLAEAALHWSVRQANELARAARGMDEREAAKSFTGRFVRFDDARCAIWAQLTKDAYATVKSTLVARATRHDHPSANDPDYEPLEARLADALVEVCIERGRRDGAPGMAEREEFVVAAAAAAVVVVVVVVVVVAPRARAVAGGGAGPVTIPHQIRGGPCLAVRRPTSSCTPTSPCSWVATSSRGSMGRGRPLSRG